MSSTSPGSGTGSIVVGPMTIDYDYASTANVSLLTSHFAGEVNVLGTPVPTEVVANTPCPINVGMGNVQGILGPLTLMDSVPAGATINVDDSADTAPETVTLASVMPVAGALMLGSITGLASAPIMYDYAGTNSLTLATSNAAGDVVNVQATGVTTNVHFMSLPVVIPALGKIHVGRSDGGVQQIQGTLNIYHAGFVDVNDAGDDKEDNATLSTFVPAGSSSAWGSIHLDLAQPINYQFAGTSSVTLAESKGNDTTIIGSLPQVPMQILGGMGTNTLVGPTLIGPDTNNTTFDVTGANAGTVGSVSFTAVGNLTGGAGSTTFVFATTGSIAGNIDGGGGTNTLDFAGYVGNITVNLRVGTATGIGGGISNIQNVTGSQGNDLLVGDANPNVLIGGTGRNIIIGGAGPDQITGGGGDNILIGGTTVWDANPVALQAIMQEWTNTSLSFDQRVNALRKGITVGRQTYALNTSTVMKDSSPDSLIGGPGQNWFFVDFDDIINNGAGPGPNDRVTRV